MSPQHSLCPSFLWTVTVCTVHLCGWGWDGPTPVAKGKHGMWFRLANGSPMFPWPQWLVLRWAYDSSQGWGSVPWPFWIHWERKYLLFWSEASRRRAWYFQRLLNQHMGKCAWERSQCRGEKRLKTEKHQVPMMLTGFLSPAWLRSEPLSTFYYFLLILLPLLLC